MKIRLPGRLRANYLEQLGKNQLPQIARKLKVTVDDVLQAMEVIRELNPKPGNSFSSRENLKYITPDVTVVKLKDYYEILLNEYMYPKMSINGYYRNMLKAGNDKETKDYVTTKVKQAEWVMQCVSQRNVTLNECFQVYCGCTGTFLYIWSGVSETFETGGCG